MSDLKVSELEKLEDLILEYKNETDVKKKHVVYLRLIQETLKLVKKIVMAFYPLPSTISKDDLIQVGAVGVLNAIETYRVEERGSFKTYVSKVIKGKIFHYLRDKANLVKTPRETIANMSKVKEAIDELSENNTKIPTVEEVARYVNLPFDKVEEIMDLGFDGVKIVAAIPDSVDYEKLLKGPVTIATEYQVLSQKWVDDKKIDGTIFRTWGTSEGFVQDNEDSIAQILIDNTSTGSSLKANRLKIVDTLMESSTRMYASKKAMADPEKKKKILELKMLFEAVLDARDRVMLEMNVTRGRFETLVTGLPSMKSPTISPLYGDDGYAIKIAVKKSEVPTLLPKLKELGATDILEYDLRKVLP